MNPNSKAKTPPKKTSIGLSQGKDLSSIGLSYILNSTLPTSIMYKSSSRTRYISIDINVV